MQMKRRTKAALCISCQTGLAIAIQESDLGITDQGKHALTTTSQINKLYFGITRKRIGNKAKTF